MVRGSLWVFTAFLLAKTGANHRGNHRSTLTDADICIGKETCHECIQTPLCAWCSAPGFEGPRCDSFENTMSPTSTGHVKCSEEFVYNPDNQLMILRFDQLRSNNKTYSYNAYDASSDSNPRGPSSGDKSPKNVQLAPQEIKLELRVRQAYNISISYSRATEFPVDVYYLSNLRPSTENGGQSHSIQFGEVLAESIKNLTSNYRLGFGATGTNSSAGGNGFHNIVLLSQDTGAFADAVRNVSFSSNSDSFEEGLDAILQAIACRNQIGWRSDSLKFLVFLTDTEFPQDNSSTTLNDARMQNDAGFCRLNERGFSAFSSNQLIHSTLSQINQTVQQNRIKIVWAVTNEQFDKFSRLSTYVEGSFVVRLPNGSTTITDLVRNSYEAMSSPVEMRDTSNGNVKVRYFSKCLDNEAARETSICEGLKFGDEVQFFAEIEATGCPENETEWSQVFSIHPMGVDESLKISLRAMCNCDCERPGHPLYDAESVTCSGAGTLKCGVCECDDRHYGRRCECVSSESGNLTSLQNQTDLLCKPDNTTSVVCSGKGSCICGLCECEVRQNAEETISGRFCECDNFSCDRSNDRICSDHGVCGCGRCTCDIGWSGPACDCPTSISTCISPVENAAICSAHGDCICGSCVCHADGGTRYWGRFCDRIMESTT